VLRYEPYALDAPGPGEALLRHEAVGLNYIDIQHRTGRYQLPRYPSPMGLEAAGVVEAVGEGVTEVAPGDRVVYSSAPLGAYADRRVMPADRLVRLPPGLDSRLAAAVFTRGLTAHYLLFTTYRVRPGDTILVHAAAGGVGLLLCQWAAALGARVIGTVGSDEKAALARRHGCAVPVVYTRDDFVAAVRRETQGRGVPVVYDGVGRDTFEGSLQCLGPRGLLVTYGTPSGPIPPFDLFRLNTLGSLYVTSPAFVTHTTERGELLERGARLFAALADGTLTPAVGHSWPLAEAARAQAALQARQTSGPGILLP
jgi:NADPH2:quinone reductase